MNILLIEDNPGDVRLIKEMLESVPEFLGTIRSTGRLSEGLSAIGDQGIDVVLLDLSLPDSHGVDTLTRVHSAATHLPVVVVTSLSDAPTAAVCLEKGAADYLIKNNLEPRLLVRSIRFAIECGRLQQQLQKCRDRNDVLSRAIGNYRSLADDLSSVVDPLIEAGRTGTISEYADRAEALRQTVFRISAIVDGIKKTLSDADSESD